jgi:hypothetical protein
MTAAATIIKLANLHDSLKLLRCGSTYRSRAAGVSTARRRQGRGSARNHSRGVFARAERGARELCTTI